MNETNQPLVAICIPVYEKLDLLKRLENSIIEQSYKKYIVIITDNSNSNEIELHIEKSRFIDLDGFVYIHNDRQIGPCSNANKCMRIGMENGASLIKIMHQDDYFANRYSLEKMVQKIEKDKTDVLFTGNYEVYKNTKQPRILSEKDLSSIKKDVSFLYRANILGAPSVMMFRTRNIEFDPVFQWLLDVDFYLRLLPGHSFSYIYEPLICIGHDGEQLSDFCLAHPDIIMQETLTLYRKYNWMHTWANRKYLLKHFIQYFIIVGRNFCRNSLSGG